MMCKHFKFEAYAFLSVRCLPVSNYPQQEYILHTVGPRLSEPSIIQTVELTALLEYFGLGVCSIKVVHQNSVNE